MHMQQSAPAWVSWFKEIDKDDGPQVGGKGANLGEMVKAGFTVPDGFVVTAQTYSKFLEERKLQPEIKKILDPLDVNDSQALQKASQAVQKLIIQEKIPTELEQAIVAAYHKLGKGSAVAVRSSATAEDLPEASFAGQQTTYLNISGDRAVLDAVRGAWASLFEARAIFYRATRGFDHFKVRIAIPVQRMVQSDISGVMFSVNPVTNDADTVIIEAIWGLGENIVQGTITPDHYEVEKGSWEVLKAQVVKQDIEMVRKLRKTKNYPVPRSRQMERKLTDAQLVELAKQAVRLQQHYDKPQDIEWAIENGKLYIVQTRPITTIKAVGAHGATNEKVEAALEKLPLLLEGEPASPGMYSGIVRLIRTPAEIHKIKVGEIMVTSMTTPDFVPAMKKAGGLITDRGGQTSHAAIVSRELGLPCVVGTDKATKVLKDGDQVTIDGRRGAIHKGMLEASILDSLHSANTAQRAEAEKVKTVTKLYVNLAEPELAKEIAQRHVEGVGLLRAEFMIANLGYHPKKLIEDGKGQVFVRQLVKGISTFCEAFGDRPVVYRATDFKTNEYRHLIGGEAYEPQEENPMIGYRGCFRYLTDERGFALELEALKKVREKYSNLWLMIPFVRSVRELQKIKALIHNAGLRRSSTFKLWMMVEIPENVILIDDYLDAGIDGVSIGTNDLTMLMMGTDRDNEHVAVEYDEHNPAVLWALERVVRKCRARNVTVSVCGQAPSTHQDITTKLVEWGVTSVSVAPDIIDQARLTVATAESRVLGKRK